MQVGEISKIIFILLNLHYLEKGFVCIYVCANALHPIHQFFSHVWTFFFSCLPKLNQF